APAKNGAAKVVAAPAKAAKTTKTASVKAANGKPANGEVIITLPSRKAKKAAEEGAAVARLPQLEGDSDGVNLQEKMRELIRLAKEQGYLTFEDLNETLPEGLVDPEQIDDVIQRLKSMGFDVIE